MRSARPSAAPASQQKMRRADDAPPLEAPAGLISDGGSGLFSDRASDQSIARAAPSPQSAGPGPDEQRAQWADNALALSRQKVDLVSDYRGPREADKPRAISTWLPGLSASQRGGTQPSSSPSASLSNDDLSELSAFTPGSLLVQPATESSDSEDQSPSALPMPKSLSQLPGGGLRRSLHPGEHCAGGSAALSSNRSSVGPAVVLTNGSSTAPTPAASPGIARCEVGRL